MEDEAPKSTAQAIPVAEFEKRRAEGKRLAQSHTFLTRQQIKYCELVASGRYKFAEAARLAGYKAKNIHKCVQQLNTNPKVVHYIETLQRDAGKRAEVTMDEIVANLRKAREQAFEQGRVGDAIKATTDLARVTGLDKSSQPSKQSNTINLWGTGNGEPSVDDLQRFNRIAGLGASPTTDTKH